MNEKEIGELRRRLRPGKNNATHICGCYVRDSGEIITTFREPLGMMPEDELEKYLALFRRTMSGGLGRNMLDISFETKEVAYGEEHKLLMKLRETSADDAQTLDAFYQKVIPTVHLDSNYVIMLLHEIYDVPFRGRDGQNFDEASDTQFSYIVCCVCPVKETKSLLSYQIDEASFHNSRPDWAVSAPELGFVFPAFDSRRTNLYNALYYTRNLSDTHSEFIETVFKTEAPMSVAEQKETFRSLLAEALEEECSLSTMQTVHEQFAELIETHKVSKDPEPLLLSKGQMQSVLQSCGVSEARAEKFAEEFESAFGENTDISPKNVVDVKHFEVKTPDVVIQVNPERSDLIQTRIIGGCRYLMIQADEGVEVNGVQIQLPEEV